MSLIPGGYEQESFHQTPTSLARVSHGEAFYGKGTPPLTPVGPSAHQARHLAYFSHVALSVSE